MKINFVCFKFPKAILFIICIVLIVMLLFGMQIKAPKDETLTISTALEQNNNKIDSNTIHPATPSTVSKQVKNQATTKTRTMPKELKGFQIIGKIEIPKLKLNKYILDKTNPKSLKVSVTKLSGPQINQIGNFCIAGHNYQKIFGKIKNLEKGDKMILTDVYGNRTIYSIYDNYTISPKDISCLNQDTSGEKEVTLITCTNGAIKRVIIKAIEIYD